MPAAILFDLDGVLYQSDAPIEGAREAVAFAQQSGIPHLFVTNTTSRPRTAIVEKLAGMGIKVHLDAVFTPPVAASQWLVEHCGGPVALLVPAATSCDFSGVDCCEIEDAEALVVGDLGEAWDYPTLNRALGLLVSKPDCPMLALGMTRYWQAEDGLRLDTGAFVTALQFASGCPPIVLGKPSLEFFRAALNRLGVAAADAWMIGDDIQSDVGGAQAAGMHGGLVRTGKFRLSDLDGEIVPDAILGSVAELPHWWDQMQAEGKRAV